MLCLTPQLAIIIIIIIIIMQNNSSDCVARVWRRIALYSKETSDQLKAYQNAVELLLVSLLLLLIKIIQESPAVADKSARRLRKVRTVYVRAVGLL